MAKVLILKANPEGEICYTNRLVKHFMTEYLLNNPADTIDIKELDSLGFVATDRDMLIYRHSGLADHDKEELFGLFDDLAEEFLSYDKYIFAYPNWNLLVPPSLVNYVLWVFRSKHLYDEKGESRLKNKKAIAIYTSGGYTNTKENCSFGLSWIKSLLNKYGMGECHFVNADGLDVEQDAKQNYEKYKAQVIELAKEF